MSPTAMAIVSGIVLLLVLFGAAAHRGPRDL